jgi:uncharacterized protein YbbC (DUF1343 family)
MMQKTRLYIGLVLLLLTGNVWGQAPVLTGADQPERYVPLLANKKVAVMVNPTSMVGNIHLVDKLLSSGVKVVKIFSPEHGFRGDADAGETIKHETDAKTGLPAVSLYGNNKKPTREQLKDVDVIVFDLQDVGTRFFTYISSMHYLMQACADYGKELLILDRPNPNGYYVDGPIMQARHKSFVGMHPIPIVHGLTVGELAQMINGEKWLDSNKTCSLTIVPVKNYSHTTPYTLPVRPSPNLPNQLSIQLYASLCLLEGTVMSVGRGTEAPFQLYGAPKPEYGSFQFTPTKSFGAKNNPLYENKVCYGVDLRTQTPPDGLSLRYLIEAYQKSPEKEKFFNNFFPKLAGNTVLQEQIKQGMSEAEIKKTWEADLVKYKAMRKKYLLYKDFE